MNIDIPVFLNHLKLDERGYPIPFFVPMDKGKPNFRYMDYTKLEQAITGHLCHICGKKLHKDYCYFISGPLGLTNQVSSDAAMHRECAQYALKVCPHMLHRQAERKTPAETGPNPHMKEKPEVLFLIKAAKYKRKFYPEYGYPLLHYKAVSAEKYIYVDNRLQKERL